MEIVTHSILGRENSKVELCQLSSGKGNVVNVAVNFSFQLIFDFFCFWV